MGSRFKSVEPEVAVARQAGAKRVDGYLTTGEAARLLGVSPKTVSRWADQGRIVHLVTIGGHRRFARSVIEQTRVAMGGNPR